MDWVRENPLKVVGLLLLFVVLYMLFSGGTSGGTATSSTTGYDAGTVQAGMQLQAAQSSQQAQLAAAQIAANAQTEQVAAAVQVAELQAQTVQQQNTLSAQVAVHQSDLASQIAESSNSLQAMLGAAQIQSQTQIAAMSEATTRAQIEAGRDVSMAGTAASAEVNKQLIASNTLIATGAQSTQVQMAREQNSGFCFITTLFVEVLGNADDCRELTVLRRYRDRFMEQSPETVEMLAEYQRVGPRIVERLAGLPPHDRMAVAHAMWRTHILPAVTLIEDGYDWAALAVYRDMVARLT